MLLQTQKPSVRPVTTAHLAQTMTLLELASEELSQKIEAAISSNPALEVVDPARCSYCQRLLSGKGVCPVCKPPQGTIPGEPIIFVSPRTDFTFQRDHFSRDELPSEEWTADEEDLAAFVLRQISPDLKIEDRPLAVHILSCLDEDGLLAVPLIEIAQYHHVPVSRLEATLHLIQRAEPIGVGSPTPQDALLIQLEVLSEYRSVPCLASEAIQKGMDLLSRRAYSDLGRRLNISAREASHIANFIAKNLYPFPARAHWGENHRSKKGQTAYRQADILISCMTPYEDSPLMVEIVSPFSGSLRVNPLFRQALLEAPSDKAEKWQSDMDSASLLVKCLQQRENTIVRLISRLVVLQRQFILRGDAYLIPLTRALLAKELEVHESTISRAVSNKAVQLPNNRIIPLSKMFDRSLHIRTALLEIIEQEVKPLSDSQIAKKLKKQGFKVARRTVAKYRSMEGILPARLRQTNSASI